MCIRYMARNGHQRALNQLNKCFFAYFVFGTALPCPLDEAIYDLRESNNFPRTSETLFMMHCLYALTSKQITNLSAVIRNGLLWEARYKGEIFLEQNQFKRLQMVRFECHRVLRSYSAFCFDNYSPLPRNPYKKIRLRNERFCKKRE